MGEHHRPDGGEHQQYESSDQPVTLAMALEMALHNGPFHQALRLAIQQRGLSLAQLRTLMDEAGSHVGQSTLSYWQRGLRSPDMPKALDVILALERVLELPAGALLTLIESQ